MRLTTPRRVSLRAWHLLQRALALKMLPAALGGAILGYEQSSVSNNSDSDRAAQTPPSCTTGALATAAALRATIAFESLLWARAQRLPKIRRWPYSFYRVQVGGLLFADGLRNSDLVAVGRQQTAVRQRRRTYLERFLVI